MLATDRGDSDAEHMLRTCIQKVATGPEHSKDLSFDEAREAMRLILDGRADPVQAAVVLIALRMKRETDDEHKGVLRAVLDAVESATASVDELVDIADPYDGYTRGLPTAPLLPPVLAACGLPAVSHGVETLGPKYGVTARKVLRAAGVDVDLTPGRAAERLADPEAGWAYTDQKAFCRPLHDLRELRTRIVKRPLLTTVEVLAGPVRARGKTRLMTGYVHKPYPRIYAMLAREAGFDSALIVRGVEGGVVPSLQQVANATVYHDGDPEHDMPVRPSDAGVKRDTRGVPLPPDLPRTRGGDEIAAAVDMDAAARAAAEAGVAALEGAAGPTRDGLVYGAALALAHAGRYGSISEAAEAARRAIDSGAALARLRA